MWYGHAMSKASDMAANGLRIAQLLRGAAESCLWLHNVAEENEKLGLCEACDEKSGLLCGLQKGHTEAHMDAFKVLKIEHAKFLGLFGTFSVLLGQAAHALELMCELSEELQVEASGLKELRERT
jgi:hypothetical protein